MITNRTADYYIQKCGGPYAFYDFLPAPLEELHTAYKKDNTLDNIPMADWLKALGYIENEIHFWTQPESENAFLQLLSTHLDVNTPVTCTPSEALLLIKTAAKQLCLLTLPIILPTKHGVIQAQFVPDKESPGIALLYNENGNGEPGVIMSYQKPLDDITLQVYPKEQPETDPMYVFHMHK